MAKPKFEIVDSFQVQSKAIPDDALELFDDLASLGKKRALKATIDATHSGRLTNMRVYPGPKMKRSLKSFLEPYRKPVLKHHDDEQDPIGRVTGASFVQLSKGDDFKFDYKNPSKGMGSGFIKLDVVINDQNSIEKFLDKRFSSFSTRQTSAEAFCSICGSDMLQDGGLFSHEHQVGEIYQIESDSLKDGKRRRADYLCYVITGLLDYREVSTVNIPGDAYSAAGGFELVQADSEESVIMKCAGDSLLATMDSLQITNGQNSVDLMEPITARDRRMLTGKTIVAISPSFDSSSMGEGDTMTEKDEVVDETVDKTEDNGDTVASDATADGKSDQSKTDSEGKEDVVVPQSEDKADADTGDSNVSTLSPGVLQTSLEAVTKELEGAKNEKNELTSEIERLKASLKEKDDEITRVREGAQDSLNEVKLAYARQLLTDRLVLGKSDVKGIDDGDGFKTQVDKYAERTLESLKDSLEDLKQELIDHCKGRGIFNSVEAIGGKPVDNPSANVPVKDKEEEKKPIRKMRTQKEQLEDFFETE